MGLGFRRDNEISTMTAVSKIAVTGATGFVGRHVVVELLKRGHRVVALVRDSTTAGLPSDVRTVEGHLEDSAALAELVRDADAVVHLAGVIAAVNRRGYLRYNTGPTQALANAAMDAGVERFVFASSLAAREEGLSDYGGSKAAAEQALRQFNGRLSVLILRAPAIYGPGDRATLPLIRQLTGPVVMIPGRREQRFSLLHVRDFTRIIADAVVGDVTGTFELSDGTPGGYGWKDLIRIAEADDGRSKRSVFLAKPLVAGVAALRSGVARLTGTPGMINPGKVRELYHHDWVARGPGLALTDPITFARGFPETLAWYRAHGWLPPHREADRSSATFKRGA